MKINIALEHLLQTRKNMIQLLDRHESKATVTPTGYNNSLLWNAAHCAVTMQLLVYKLSGNNMSVSDELINLYRKGTKALEKDVTSISSIKELLLSSVTQLQADYDKGLFTSYSEYPTSYGITLNSVEDAILFNNSHEALHFGYMMAMCKQL